MSPNPHSQPQNFKALVLGSGQGGTPLTTALAAAGHKTALIESTHVGGTCINEGCTPTKTMVASAKVACYARRAADFGVVLNGAAGGGGGEDRGKDAGEGGVGVSVDMDVVRRRKREIVASFRGGSEGRLEKAENVEVIRGKAAFVGPKEVRVRLNGGAGERTVTADWVFVNVGCRPAPLAIPGVEDIEILDSTSIMELGVVPRHLVVIGGGYVGLEFAQMFHRFGAKVTVVQRGGQLLGREDRDVADAVRVVLEEDGVDVLLGAKAERVEKAADGEVKLVVDVKGEKRVVVATHVLAAAGRVPNTTDLGLEKAGVEMVKGGFVGVDEKLRTNVEGVFAMGDVKGGPAFTHISYDDFRVLKSNLLDGGNASIQDRLVPYAVFIDPQLGRIGLTEDEAGKMGRKVRVGKMPMGWVARALEMDESRGFIKVLVDAESGMVLGAAVLGIDGGEVMSMLQIAMMGKLPYTALRDGIFAHPLLAESLNNLFGNLEG